MKDFMTIFKYVFKKQVRSKAYIITTAILCIGLLISFLGIKFANEGSEKSEIYFINRTSINVDKMEECNKILTASFMTVTEDSSDNVLKEKILKDEKPIVILEYNDQKKIHIKVLDNDYINLSDLKLIQLYVDSQFKKYIGQKHKLQDDLLNEMSQEIQYDLVQVKEKKSSNYAVTYILYMLMAMAIMMYSATVAGEITYAKSNRVMEVLITSVKPSAIFLGITAAIGASSILQFAIIVLSGFLGFKIAGIDAMIMESFGISLSGLTAESILIFIAFFILGFILYSLLNAAVGSLVSKTEDIAVSVLPIQFLGLIQFFMGLFALSDGDSLIIKICSYFPFTSQTTMFVRYMMGYIGIGNVVVSIIIMITVITFESWFAVKLFKFGVMFYGNLDLKKLIASKK